MDAWAGDEGDNPVSAVVDAAADEGVLFGSGRPSFQIIVSPPLCTDEDGIRHGVGALDDAVGDVF